MSLRILVSLVVLIVFGTTVSVRSYLEAAEVYAAATPEEALESMPAPPGSDEPGPGDASQTTSCKRSARAGDDPATELADPELSSGAATDSGWVRCLPTDAS